MDGSLYQFIPRDSIVNHVTELCIGVDRYIPSRLCDDHLCAELVELLPQIFGFQAALDRRRTLLVRARIHEVMSG